MSETRKLTAFTEIKQEREVEYGMYRWRIADHFGQKLQMKKLREIQFAHRKLADKTWHSDQGTRPFVWKTIPNDEWREEKTPDGESPLREGCSGLIEDESEHYKMLEK